MTSPAEVPFLSLPSSAELNHTLWLCMTPFDLPVVPEVHKMAQVSPWS